MPEKIDLYKLHKAGYVTPKDPVFVTIGAAKYLTVYGQGEPGGDMFQSMLGALYGVAYTIKMAKKFAGQDYKVCGLEGLWWGFEQPRESWRWKLMIRVPEFIAARGLKGAVAKPRRPLLHRTRHRRAHEGLHRAERTHIARPAS
jgi:hypothetical protein